MLQMGTNAFAGWAAQQNGGPADSYTRRFPWDLCNKSQKGALPFGLLDCTVCCIGLRQTVLPA